LHAIFGFSLSYQNRKGREAKLASGAACAAQIPRGLCDFLPWRFSSTGRRSAWLDRHPGGRKPAQETT
jgi:hypothetical protein